MNSRLLTSDSPFVADWFVVSLRWLTLLGLSISLSIGDRLLESVNAIILVVVAWNIFMSLLAGLSKRLPYHRHLSVFVDMAAAVLFFWLHDGFSGPAWWVLVLPILSATLYFEWIGAMLSAGALALLQVGLTWLQTPASGPLWLSAASALVTLGMGALFAYLSRGLIENLRRSRQTQQAARERARKLENERLRAIYNLTSTLNATLNYQRVLETALDLSLKAMVTDPESEIDPHLVSAVLLFEGGNLKVGLARRLTQADMRNILPGQAGILGRVISEGEPLLGRDLSTDPELNRIIAFRNCDSVYCFPMRSGFNIYGVLVFGHPQPGYFSADRCEMLNTIGHQSIIAIQNARLYQDLVEEKERMIEVQEEARRKLARDLHDGPTQSVAAMAMRVNLARRMVERDPQAAVTELAKIEELARRTTKEIRHMLFTLRPLVLESQGLVPALRAMAEKMKETYSQEVLINVDEAVLPQLELGRMGVIFYLVEEAVNNARKHAQAGHIWVRLRPLEKDQEILLLEIADDGVGFDVEAVNRAYDKRGSLGMVNLRERSELVNGLLQIDSKPGSGTRVQVYIPLNEEAADRMHHARK